MMYSQIFLRCNSLKNISINLGQVPRYFSHRISLLKSTLTPVLRQPRNVQFIGSSTRLHISNSRFHECKHSEGILAEQKTYNFTSVRRLQSNTLDVNTNITNNVFLYKYERPRFFTFLNIFAPFQCIFWLCMGYLLFKQLPMRDTNLQPLSKYTYDNFITIFSASTAVFLGISVAALMWAFAARSVRYIVLKKGGKAATFITYHPFKGKVGTTAPIEHISCKTARKEMSHYLPIKMKGRLFFYILDSGGDFMNPKLFDYTIGVVRF